MGCDIPGLPLAIDVRGTIREPCWKVAVKGGTSMKLIGLMMLFVGAAGSIVAGSTSVPEIDAASSVGALVLLSGALLVIQGRRRKR
jgi:hypothetical protein